MQCLLYITHYGKACCYIFIYFRRVDIKLDNRLLSYVTVAVTSYAVAEAAAGYYQHISLRYSHVGSDMTMHTGHAQGAFIRLWINANAHQRIYYRQISLLGQLQQFFLRAAVDSAAANQQVAMWCNSTANLTNYLDLADQGGYEIGVGFIPKNVQNKVPTGGCNLVMTSRVADARRAAAGEFINFMTSKDAAVKNHLKTGYLLTRQSASDDDRIKDAYSETPEYQVAFDQLEYAVGDCMNSGFDEAAKIYIDAFEGVMSTGEDPEDKLKAAAEQATSVLAQNA